MIKTMVTHLNLLISEKKALLKGVELSVIF